MIVHRCDRCGVEGKTTRVGNFEGYFLSGPPLPGAWVIDLCAMCEAAVKAVALRRVELEPHPFVSQRPWWKRGRA